MTTYESVAADITNLFNTFDKFVKLYESNTWISNVTIEDIKSSFKLAKFIEDSVVELQIKECTDTFLKVLNGWWLKNNRTKVYNADFYSKACDHLLQKFFQKNIAHQTLDNAIRMYTSFIPRDRFETVINNLMLTCATYTQIFDYAIANKNEFNVLELECRLLLRNWSQECQCGRMENIKEVVANMFLSYKLKSSLPVIIRILTIDNNSDEEMVISVILENLYIKMDDRSVLSKQFWLTLFQHVDKLFLSKVCIKYNDFLKKLLDFIVYIGCMMNYEIHNFELKWVGDPVTSICPNLTYNDLVNMVKFLFNYHSDLRKYVDLLIIEAKKGPNPKLWNQLINDI